MKEKCIVLQFEKEKSVIKTKNRLNLLWNANDFISFSENSFHFHLAWEVNIRCYVIIWKKKTSELLSIKMTSSFCVCMQLKSNCRFQRLGITDFRFSKKTFLVNVFFILYISRFSILCFAHPYFAPSILHRTWPPSISSFKVSHPCILKVVN